MKADPVPQWVTIQLWVPFKKKKKRLKKNVSILWGCEWEKSALGPGYSVVFY